MLNSKWVLVVVSRTVVCALRSPSTAAALIHMCTNAKGHPACFGALQVYLLEDAQETLVRGIGQRTVLPLWGPHMSIGMRSNPSLAILCWV
jgi:hypothetical protein